MKVKLFIVTLLLFAFSELRAQRQIRIGYVNMDYILQNMPNYKDANAALDQKIEQWKQEISLKKQKIKGLEEKLENERPLLTQDLIDERQDQIDFLRLKLQQYEQKRFGPKGDMMRQRRQILQPIQDEVFNAIQEIGNKREYDFIYNSAVSVGMLYAAKRHDISNEILSMITRNATINMRNQERINRNPEKNGGEKVYKSVRQAREERDRIEKRQTAIQKRKQIHQSELNRRQNRRDSIQNARKKAYETRRTQVMEQRQARRDSLRAVRAQMLKERREKRDSLMQARQKIRKKSQ